ncbi:unnamed protein product [Diatraea saccharalis]|uniref:Androglobin domain-containing protein n=1 Tax=Diatraea saccharalis TaxID=40085 RepID=A0A9P0C8R4_9NEOP|nr:unnamed protein product [Diatraea saccharalis]
MVKKGTAKDGAANATVPSPGAREELREWVQYDALHTLVKNFNVLYFPSMYQFTSAGNSPPVRITKGASNKPIDIVAPKCAPFYLQIDGPEENTVRISLNMLHPRIMFNSGIPISDYIEPAYLILEKFEWFVDCDLPIAKAYIQTRGYDSVEVTFKPGRHICRSYQPDLEWDSEKIGYNKALIHWMFRQALQSVLAKRLSPVDYRNVCGVLRRYFCDPDFGLPDKPKPQKSLRDIANMDPCDCLLPEAEELGFEEEIVEEQEHEEKPLIDEAKMAQLLKAPKYPVTSQVCELATEELPCGVLKEEREKVIKKHEAATVLQAHWRGTWARKCLQSHVIFTPEITKIIMENAFGNLDALSALMNEFFAMFPTVKPAFSVASALTGTYGVRQFNGVTPVTVNYKWIPYFQGVFYCHEPVKVHFDLQSSLQFSTIAVYDNDTGLQKPQVFNAHITFDFSPNNLGYTVIGHGTLNHPVATNAESHWQLTVLSSINEAFHICDNDADGCKEQQLPHSFKLHIDEIYLPNTRNILGGIQISVLKNEVVSFRAAATSPELEIEVKLRKLVDGQKQEIARCAGKGEVFWPYVKLEAQPLNEPTISKERQHGSARSVKTPVTKPLASGGKNKSITKPASAKSKDKEKEQPAASNQRPPMPDDAFVVIECALAIGGGAFARRDDDRDLELAAAIKSWDLKEPGRNLRGAQIRKEFRTEFLEAVTVPPSESEHTLLEEAFFEEIGEEDKKDDIQQQQGPTPASESGILEMTVESEEEAKYLVMPEQLKDKFIPLYFVPLCMREKDENLCVLITPDRAEAAKQNRQARIEAALNRMRELQVYNESFVLGKQKMRCQLLEKLFIDSQWNPELTQVLEARDEAITTEILNRTLSATKKKQDSKKK